ncbi:MAG: YkgJ family cysteine cluster protein [Bacteriovoracaceae bacterium]|nr:YkgJ family cysteine cluster protein [Bacteriovoracaceae bacterium]
MDKLQKIKSAVKRSRFVYREIDLSLKKLFDENHVTSEISCKRGCSFCCHTQVSVTCDEAELFAEKVIKGHKIDFFRLYIQSQAGNNSEKWYLLPYEMRKCVFLNDNDECSIYDDRPSVCRTNYVFSIPFSCSTQDGLEKSVRLLLTKEADMIIMAANLNSNENGVLPYLLNKVLNKTKQPEGLRSGDKAYF